MKRDRIINSVNCPVDSRLCKKAECIEFHGTPEKPCISVSKNLGEVAYYVGQANVKLGVYGDPEAPQIEEHEKCVNVTATIFDFSERLGTEKFAFLNRVVNDAINSTKRHKKRRK